ncbi:MAG TPA: hypothetical protein VGB72_06820 [Acidobacteriota bacterium]
MPTKNRFLLNGLIAIFASWLLSGFPVAQESVFAAALVDYQADVQSQDSVLKAFYESLTFPEGSGPDWGRFRNLFASATVPLIRTTPGAVLVTDLDGFLDNFSLRIKSGALNSFNEEEIFRSTHSFGNIAQVFSTYRKGLNTPDPQKLVRGINSLQVVFKDGRWWIVSLMWQDESPDNPIPQKYLK